MVTAAHCVHDKSGEIIPARTLSIMLGLHDRGKYDQEPKRCVTYPFPLVSKKTFSNTNKFVILLRVFRWYHYNFFARKEIKVDDIFVHESFNLTLDQVQANDIALLRLGEYL